MEEEENCSLKKSTDQVTKFPELTALEDKFPTALWENQWFLSKKNPRSPENQRVGSVSIKMHSKGRKVNEIRNNQILSDFYSYIQG